MFHIKFRLLTIYSIFREVNKLARGIPVTKRPAKECSRREKTKNSNKQENIVARSKIAGDSNIRKITGVPYQQVEGKNKYEVFRKMGFSAQSQKSTY